MRAREPAGARAEHTQNTRNKKKPQTKPKNPRPRNNTNDGLAQTKVDRSKRQQYMHSLTHSLTHALTHARTKNNTHTHQMVDVELQAKTGPPIFTFTFQSNYNLLQTYYYKNNSSQNARILILSPFPAASQQQNAQPSDIAPRCAGSEKCDCVHPHAL
jgi:hypothetical protein